MRRCILLVALVFLAGCSGGKVLEPQRSLPEEDDIREAVFRYQFEHNYSGLQQKAKFYFLSISSGLGKDKDPSDEFMQRFQGHQPPVKKVSQSKFTSTRRYVNVVIDKETGERGLTFRMGSIKWKIGAVEVEGGYFEHGLSSSRNIYSVAREGGKWVVKEDRLVTIA